jgi:hypothetical protein
VSAEDANGSRELVLTCNRCYVFFSAMHFIDLDGKCHEQCAFLEVLGRNAGWECDRCPEGENPTTPTPEVGIELTDGVESAKFSVGAQEFITFFISVPSASTVTCTTDADNGDLDLWMNRNGEPLIFDCVSETETSSESCTISAGPGTAYAFVFGFEHTSDSTVTCTLSTTTEKMFSPPYRMK